MRVEIIQLIRRPRHDDERTDFPAIAFRTVAWALTTDQAEAVADAPPDGRRRNWQEP
jgi:hypothetical protein